MQEPSMSNRARLTWNLASIIAVVGQCVCVVAFLTKMSYSVDQIRDTLTGMRDDLKYVQKQIHELDVRQSVLEQKQRSANSSPDLGREWKHDRL